MQWHGVDPSFMDIWSKWRLNYDYANFAERYIFLIITWFYPLYDDDDISKLQPKASLTFEFIKTSASTFNSDESLSSTLNVNVYCWWLILTAGLLMWTTLGEFPSQSSVRFWRPSRFPRTTWMESLKVKTVAQLIINQSWFRVQKTGCGSKRHEQRGRFWGANSLQRWRFWLRKYHEAMLPCSFDS